MLKTKKKKLVKKAKKTKKNFISFDSDDAEQGGLPDDLDAIITEMECVLFDYNGTLDEPVPAIRVEFTPIEEGAEPFEQHYTAGSSKRLIPSDDGGCFVPNEEENSKSKGLTTGCNAHIFLTSLQDAGFPPPKEWEKPDQLGETIVGTLCHVMRVPQKQRKGLEVAEGEGDARPKTILVVTEIHGMPGEDHDDKIAELTSGGKKKGKAKAKPAKKAVAKKAVAKKKSKKDEDEEEEEEEEDEDEESDDDEEEEEEEADDDSDDDEEEESDDDDEDSDDEDDDEDADEGEDTPASLAAEMLVNAISHDPKAKKNGLAIDEVFPAIFEAAKKHTKRKAIVAAAQDKNFLKNAEGITVDKKKKVVKLA